MTLFDRRSIVLRMLASGLSAGIAGPALAKPLRLKGPFQEDDSLDGPFPDTTWPGGRLEGDDQGAMPMPPPDGASPQALYGPVAGEPFPIPGVKLSIIKPQFVRRTVPYDGYEEAGSVVIDPAQHYLYFVQGDGSAIRYGVGVGKTGFGWSGDAVIHDKQRWPDWYPPKEMLDRQPDLREKMQDLQSGIGMPGGPGNPLGARAMYLWQGNKDTLYRVHGTVEPWTIGHNVSSGCIRMINQDAIDLYDRVAVGARVRVLPASAAARSRISSEL